MTDEHAGSVRATFSDQPDIPDRPMHTGMMDDQTLDNYVRDLNICATVHEVTTKGGANVTADAAQRDVGDALMRLRAGHVRGVQVRYGFDGALWCDTLMRVEDEIHIVRMRQDQF